MSHFVAFISNATCREPEAAYLGELARGAELEVSLKEAGQRLRMYAGRCSWLLLVVALCAAGCAEQKESARGVSPSARSWSKAETLDESRVAYWIRAAQDSDGNAMIVWDDLDGKVNAKRYDGAKEVWEDSEQLDPDNPEDSAVPDLVIDTAGNALAMWQRQSQEDDARTVWTSRYDADKGSWRKAVQLANSDLVLSPQLAVDRHGNGLVAFTRADIGASVMTAHFDAERETWSEAEPLEAPQATLAAAPQVAMTPSGSGVALWMDGDPAGRSTIWAARYEMKTRTWGAPRAITEKVDMGLPTGVAINQEGTAVAVWVQNDGDTGSVWTSWSRASREAWSKPERIDAEGRGGPMLPRIALDQRGNALVVWGADDGERQRVWADRYSAKEQSWEGAKELHGGEFDAFAPTLGIDDSGNVLVAWIRKQDASASPWFRWYVAAEEKWTPAAALDADAEGEAQFLEVKVSSDGRALAVWSRDGSSILASHFR